jgi:23S rRNA (pseudouridine1915-N3)-methyltransferase
MKLVLAWIGTGRASRNEWEAEYLRRIQAYASAEIVGFRSEDEFFSKAVAQQARTAPVLVLLDSRGRQLTSEQFAEWLGRQRDEGRQRIVFAIGPADGWSEAARKRAGLLLSLGPMTLPHELARAVLCEQVYRAFTILSGHPYHTGH